MKIFASIIKRDDEKRMVYGYASTEALDSQGERVSKAAIEAALPDYMRWANVREMHQASAVGVTKSAEIDDTGLYIQAKIVDDKAWNKVKEEVYKGFSIGGKSIAKTDEMITELKLTEISLVDRPANPECAIELWKSADGMPAPVPLEKSAIEKLAVLVNGGQISPQQLLELAEGAVSKRSFSDKKRKELADKGHALPDGSFPIENTGDLKNAIKAFGRAKDKAKAKAHIIARAKDLKATNLLPADWRGSTKEEGDGKAAGAEDIRKGLYQVGWLANLLDAIACLHAENCWEQTQENDADSKVPEQLEEWLQQGCEILAEMVSEECAEQMGVAGNRTPKTDVTDKEGADKPGDLAKLVAVLRKAFPAKPGEPQDTPEFARAELARRAADAIEKAGAKFSAGTRKKLEEAHGHVKKAAEHMEKARGAPVAEADGHLDKCEKCIDKADEGLEALGYSPREDADDEDDSGESSRGGKDQKGKAAGDALAAALTPDALTKAQADFAAELAKRDTTITELQKRLKALEDQPLPAKGPTRAVSKEDDNGSGNAGTPAIEPVLNADGTVDEAATAMKKAQATPTFSRQPSVYYRPRAAR